MHQQQAQLIIRIDQEFKKQAQESAKKLGLSLSSLVKVLLKKAIKAKKIILTEDKFDTLLIEACQEKEISSRLEKLAMKTVKKYS